jgi:hypothetical protein
MKRFYTAVGKMSEVRSEQAPIDTPLGPQFPSGTPLKLNGLRHAMGGEMTLCGIPADEVVYLGTAFAPDEPGACPVCMAEAEGLDAKDDRPEPPYPYHAPADTWMAEWEPEMVREWQKVWQSGDRWAIDLLLAVNRLWNLQDNLPRVRAALEKGGVHTPLLNASEIEVLARLGMAEFRRLTSSE